jgi:outer membrane lipoprotein LolB
LNLIKHAFLVVLIFAIGACASQPTVPTSKSLENLAIHQTHMAKLDNIQAFSLKGRLGVVTQKQGFSGSIEWQHQANKDHQTSLDNIDVYSPIGGKMANITKTSKQVALTDQKGLSISADDAETLTETTLGFRLPLSGLSDWVLSTLKTLSCWRPTKSLILKFLRF